MGGISPTCFKGVIYTGCPVACIFLYFSVFQQNTTGHTVYISITVHGILASPQLSLNKGRLIILSILIQHNILSFSSSM